MKVELKYLILFFVGGSLYYLVEVLWRGHSHYSMFFAGGLCFILCGLINEILDWDTPLVLQGLFGSVIITLVEFIFGMILNVHLGLNIWDYSDLPLNLFGQISLPYTLLWIPLAMLAIVFDDYLRYWLFGEEKPHYRLWTAPKTAKL